MGDSHSQRFLRPRSRIPHVPDLPLHTRILLSILGWLLIVLGVAGLVLPGLQGIVILALGGAILSLASRVMLRALRWCFKPWPKAWRRLLLARARVLRWLTKAPEL